MCIWINNRLKVHNNQDGEIHLQQHAFHNQIMMF